MAGTRDIHRCVALVHTQGHVNASPTATPATPATPARSSPPRCTCPAHPQPTNVELLLALHAAPLVGGTPSAPNNSPDAMVRPALRDATPLFLPHGRAAVLSASGSTLPSRWGLHLISWQQNAHLPSLDRIVSGRNQR